MLVRPSQRPEISTAPAGGAVFAHQRIYSASPLAGDGKVYLFSETGETVVLQAGRELRVLQRNDLGERVVSSPAVSDGRIFIRTDESLVAVGR